jgi:hypothetical protein
MRSLSDALLDLAARVKAIEESARAAKDESQAVLEERRRTIQNALDAQVREFESTVDKAEESVQHWWRETRGAVEGQVRAIREDIARWRAQRDVAGAERAAKVAEEEAAAAMEMATYTLNLAEFAAVDAALARAEARSLAEGGAAR